MRYKILGLLAIAALTFYTSTGKHEHERACGNSYLDQLVIQGKIDPRALSRSLDELDRIADGKGPQSMQAHLRKFDLEDWGAFRYSSDPRDWPERLEEREPTMVYQNPDTGETTVFWGGFAYSVGSQFRRSGWFIDSFHQGGMTIEHRGTRYNEPTWEIKEITFRDPYIKAYHVGPEGFARWGMIEPPSWDELKEGYERRSKEDAERKAARDKRERKRMEAWRNPKPLE